MENNEINEKKIEKIEKIKEIKHIKRKKIIILFCSIFIFLIIITLMLLIIKNPQTIQAQWIAVNSEKNNLNEKNQKQIDKEEKKQKEKAEKVALKKFKELGESVDIDRLETIRIQRDGKLYYYISSPENTAEISIETNKIVRLNSVFVENL